jgi:hypothetical protein
MDDWQADLIVASVIFPQQVCKAAQFVPVDVVVVVVVVVFVPVVVHTGAVQAAAVTQAPRVVRQLMQVAPVAVASVPWQLVSQLVCVVLPSHGQAMMQFM